MCLALLPGPLHSLVQPGVENEADAPLSRAHILGGRERAPRSRQDKDPGVWSGTGLQPPAPINTPSSASKQHPQLRLPSLATRALLTLNHSDPTGGKLMCALPLRMCANFSLSPDVHPLVSPPWTIPSGEMLTPDTVLSISLAMYIGNSYVLFLSSLYSCLSLNP